jgi:Tfp pilus assembly protein PilF
MFLKLLRGIVRSRVPPAAVAECTRDSLQRAFALQAGGDDAGAEQALREAIERDERRADALQALGALLQRCKRDDEAIAPLEEAARLLPRSAEAHLQLAAAYWSQRLAVKALAALAAALRLAPDLAAAHNNVGVIYRALGHLPDAEAAFLRALSIDPARTEVWRNLARTQIDCGEPEAAMQSYLRLLGPGADLGETPPADAQKASVEAQWNLGLAQLATGNLDSGWRNYELRLHPLIGLVAPRPLGHALWRGEALGGRKLVVWGEQGIGDEILFAGMYPDLLALGGDCVFECKPKLLQLFARSFPGAQVIARTQPPQREALEGAHYQIAAGSLGRYLRGRLSDFPDRRGYLVADDERVQHWRARLGALGPGLKVGFCWRSSNTKGERALACTRLEQWGKLFGLGGVHWVCLQYDECAEELADAQERFGLRLHRFGEVDYFDDLDEVAALMQALDLVISAPTTVSMQAAALGVPTWQMTYGTDWQLLGGASNPWFPAMERFVRAGAESWEPVFAALAQRLRALACGGAKTSAARA